MSGVTDSAFRRLVKHASGDSVGLLVTEFISVEGLSRKDLRSWMRLESTPSERPLCVQIFGGEPHKMAQAAAIAQDHGADVLDINCGCPAPRVVRRGGGADLHRDLPRLRKILEAVRPVVADLPLTLKMRSGWNEESINAIEMGQLAVDCGVDALAVHGRTRVQLYRGKQNGMSSASWRVRSRFRYSAQEMWLFEDVALRMKQTGCAGVMIGRAAIGNPWIFRQVEDSLAGREVFEPTTLDLIRAVEVYFEFLCERLPAKALGGRMKQVIARLCKGIPGSQTMRRDVLRPTAGADVLDSFRSYILEKHGEKARFQTWSRDLR